MTDAELVFVYRADSGRFAAAIDIAHKLQLTKLLQQFTSRGVAVLMVVHDFSYAAQYADKVVAMNKGRAVACGAPVEVLEPATLQEIFGVALQVITHPQTGKPLIIAP